MLLDTSGLLCFLHQDEAQHKTAVELISNYNGRFITHNYVLAELIALSLVRRFPRSTVLMYSLELMENPNVEMVWVDEILHREAMDLLLVRQDKTYSIFDSNEVQPGIIKLLWCGHLARKICTSYLRKLLYSLCDAISFVLMRKKGIREALTTDKHFEQEGFTRLLQS